MKPPEEVKRDLVQRWLARAEEDFGVAEHILDADVPYLFSVAFHAQQAAEKFLKAFLVHHQIEFPKIHDLGKILDLANSVAPDMAKLLADVTSLNPYGVDVRYPGDIPEITVADARAAVTMATKVRNTVLGSLKG